MFWLLVLPSLFSSFMFSSFRVFVMEFRRERSRTMSERFCLQIALLMFLLASTPTVRGADTGTIRGKVAKAGVVTAVTAIDRANAKNYPGKIDGKSGAFIIVDLPLGATY